MLPSAVRPRSYWFQSSMTIGWALALALGCWTPAGAQDTVTVELAASADTYVRQGGSGGNHGDESILEIKKGGVSRTLVRFDEAEILAATGGAQLVSAHLELTIDRVLPNFGNSGRPVAIHALEVPWAELGATWSCADDPDLAGGGNGNGNGNGGGNGNGNGGGNGNGNGGGNGNGNGGGNGGSTCPQPWTGGQFAATATDSVIHRKGMTGLVRYDVTTDVGALLVGGSHHGWLLKLADESKNGQVDYHSRETGQPPRLVLEVDPDSEPPTIEIVAPTAVEILDDPTPEIRVSFADAESGVDLDAFRLTVDGFDLLPYCTVEPTGAVCEPPALAEGPHTLVAEIRDLAGLAGFAHHNFVLFYDIDDFEPPTLTLLEPVGDPAPGVHDPVVRLEYSDVGSGLDLTSFELRIDGLDFTALCDLGPSQAVCQPWPLAAGDHLLEARVADLAGFDAIVEASFTIVATVADTTRPELILRQPEHDSVVEGPLTVLVEFSDGETGIDRSSLVVVVDGTDVTDRCRVDATSATCPSPALVAGPHRVTAQVKDLLGNGLLARSFFEVVPDASDVEPPSVTFVVPDEEPILGALLEQAIFQLTDAASGVDLSSVGITIAGLEVTPSCSIGTETRCPVPYLPAGTYQLAVTLADVVGNSTTVLRDFEVLDRVPDEVPPALAFVAPAAEVGEGPVVVRVAFSDSGGAGIATDTLAVTLDGQTLSCDVGALSATCPVVSLALGSHGLAATVADRDGNSTAASLSFEVVPERGRPSITFLAPPETVTGTAQPPIVVRYRDAVSGVDLTTFRLWIDEVDVTSGCSIAAAGADCTSPPLESGPHRLTAEIHDLRGNVGRSGQIFTLATDLGLSITAPAEGLLTRGSTVTVEGLLDQEVERVTVSGGAGEVEAEVTGSSFLAEDVPLAEGSNVITAVARFGGAVGVAKVSVVRDTEPPSLVIRTPRDGEVLTSGQIVVAGDLIDPLPGHLEAPVAQVEVGGVAARVEQGTFVLDGLLLQPGENRIVATAVDAAGNTARAEVTVRSDPAASRRIEILGGQGQAGTVGSTLAEPLTVRLVDALGQPLPGRSVTFRVARGTGSVTAGTEVGRELVLPSDEHGLASVFFDLGGRAGLGNHEVVVTSPGFEGRAVFCASAEAVGPQRIVPVAGGDQSGVRRGAVGQEYLQPLLAQVFDRQGNALPGIAVTFRVVLGGGGLVAESTPADSLEVVTDADGIAAARYVLGPEAGIANNLVEATFPGLDESPATFLLSGAETGPEPFTRLSGLVLDNQDQPVPGVTIHVGEAQTTADAEGRFELSGVPAGWIHLEVDGGTATRPGTWPHLEYAFQLLAGIDNDLGMPIRLPRIDTAGGRVVGGPTDIEIPMAGVPGASLTVFANSVTFPDGSRTGELSFTQVLADKVPMVAPLGSNFALAFTIQPPGVRFDPPARVRIPNLGDAPGTEVDVFSFDHDLGEFVTAGSAAVTEDGLFLQTALGSGIRKSGWGGCTAPPPPTGDTCGEGGCTICVDKRLEPKCDPVCEICTGSACEKRKVEEVTALANDKTEDDEVIVGVGQEVQFEPQIDKGNCSEYDTTWRFGDGEESTDESPTHEYKTEGDKTIELTVQCKDCPEGGTAMDSIRIKVVKLEFEGAFQRLDTASEMMLTTEMEDVDGDGMDDDFFRVLGGVRQRLELQDHPDLAGRIEELTWSATAGSFYDGFASTAMELTGGALSGAMLSELYWQGPWTTGNDHEVMVTVDLDDDNEVEGTLLIRTRQLTDSSSDGDDIAMLQYLLRMYGLSESTSPGFRGRAVGVDRGFGTGTSRAVRRFKVRDELVPCGTTNSQYRACIAAVANTVDDDVLEAIENHWDDFQAAQEAFAMNNQILITDPRFVTQWVPATSALLQNSYTLGLHATAAPGHDYNRMVEEWLRKEGSRGQWGRQVPFRHVLGGADELGSIGFSQITNTNKYGPTNLSAVAALNLYHPEENCRGLAAFSNSSGFGMHRAFLEGNAARDYTATANFASFPRLGMTYTDTVRDRVSKGIMAYNRGPNLGAFRTDPWPVMLKENIPPDATTGFGTRTAIGYSLQIQSSAGMGDVCWEWTDRVIDTGINGVCDTAPFVVPPDQVLAPLFPPPIPPPPMIFEPCVAAGTIGEEMLSVPLGDDQYTEFTIRYCVSDWLAGRSWAEAWNLAFPTALP